MEELAVDAPNLFLESDVERLRDRIEDKANTEGESPYQDKNIELEVALDPLNQISESGPETDAHYALLVRQAFSGISPAQAADGSFWASVNCFALSPYTSVRWGKSNINKPSNFIKRHWLWIGTGGRTWNAAARLWWLVEIAHRASRHSTHSLETLLEYMANNVELYHQFTSRTYLSSNPILVAAVYDIAIGGNEHLFQRPYPNQLMISLNIKAGTMSFDIFNYDELYEIVESSLPPLGQGAAG